MGVTVTNDDVNSERRRCFEDLWSAHYGSILAFLRRRLPGEDALDAAADVFTVAWRRIDEIPVEALPWLYAVGRFVLQDRTRTHRRQGRLVERLSDPSQLPGGALAESETRDVDWEAAFQSLSPAHQECLRLTYWEDLDPRQAALASGCSKGAFLVRLHRARTRMRALLEAGHKPAMSTPSAPSDPIELANQEVDLR